MHISEMNSGKYKREEIKKKKPMWSVFIIHSFKLSFPCTAALHIKEGLDEIITLFNTDCMCNKFPEINKSF